MYQTVHPDPQRRRARGPPPIRKHDTLASERFFSSLVGCKRIKTPICTTAEPASSASLLEALFSSKLLEWLACSIGPSGVDHTGGAVTWSRQIVSVD
jgi:hypothetical protein